MDNTTNTNVHSISGIVMGLLMTKGPLNFLLTGETPAFFEGGVRNQRTWGSGVASGGSSGGLSGTRAGRTNYQNTHVNGNTE